MGTWRRSSRSSAADLEFGWELRDSPRLEHYRTRFPSLFSSQEWLCEVAAEEFSLRDATGDDPDPLEYRERFGLDPFAGEPAAVVPPVAWPADRTPKVGDTILPGFVLEAEFGAGMFGQV